MKQVIVNTPAAIAIRQHLCQQLATVHAALLAATRDGQELLLEVTRTCYRHGTVPSQDAYCPANGALAMLDDEGHSVLDLMIDVMDALAVPAASNSQDRLDSPAVPTLASAITRMADLNTRFRRLTDVKPALWDSEPKGGHYGLCSALDSAICDAADIMEYIENEEPNTARRDFECDHYRSLLSGAEANLVRLEWAANSVHLVSGSPTPEPLPVATAPVAPAPAPTPVGTVRGPFSSGDPKAPSVQFMVLGHNGWVPFIRPRRSADEATCRAAAEEYAESLTATPSAAEPDAAAAYRAWSERRMDERDAFLSAEPESQAKPAAGQYRLDSGLPAPTVADLITEAYDAVRLFGNFTCDLYPDEEACRLRLSHIAGALEKGGQYIDLTGLDPLIVADIRAAVKEMAARNSLHLTRNRDRMPVDADGWIAAARQLADSL
jgi:hypothetical protein